MAMLNIQMVDCIDLIELWSGINLAAMDVVTSQWDPCDLPEIPSGYVKIAIENGPVEIADLPSYKMVVFHSYVTVYQSIKHMNRIQFDHLHPCAGWVYARVLQRKTCGLSVRKKHIIQVGV